MKRFFAMLTVLLLVVALFCACTPNKAEENQQDVTTPSIEDSTADTAGGAETNQSGETTAPEDTEEPPTDTQAASYPTTEPNELPIIPVTSATGTATTEPTESTTTATTQGTTSSTTEPTGDVPIVTDPDELPMIP